MEGSGEFGTTRIEKETIHLKVEKREGSLADFYSCLEGGSDGNFILQDDAGVLLNGIPQESKIVSLIERGLKDTAPFIQVGNEEEIGKTLLIIESIYKGANREAIRSGSSLLGDSSGAIIKVAKGAPGEKWAVIGNVGKGVVFKMGRDGIIEVIAKGNEEYFAKDESIDAEVTIVQLGEGDRIFAVSPAVAEYLAGKKIRGEASSDPIAIVRQIIKNARTLNTDPTEDMNVLLVDSHSSMASAEDSSTEEGLRREWETLFGEIEGHAVVMTSSGEPLKDKKGQVISGPNLVEIIKNEIIPHAKEIIEGASSTSSEILRSVPRSPNDWRKRVQKLLKRELELRA